MNMSSNSELASVPASAIAAMQYHDIQTHPFVDPSIRSVPASRNADGGNSHRAEVELSEEEFAERIRRERSDATLHAEERLRQEYELKLLANRETIAAAITGFEQQRTEYYARAEAEILHLALAIAAKILHRESQVDPMLVATLVRMAVDKMREGSSVIVRVSPERAAKWREYFAGHSKISRVEVAEDAKLTDLDCLLETDLGVANFGLETQLKEVEQGFFDLLALRPTNPR
jgi:flagellar assembly protein FliH